MRYFRCDKLVRDRIVDHMMESGQQVVGQRILTDEEFICELKKKICEEAEELAVAVEIKDVKNELADLEELIELFKQFYGLSEEELSALQTKKVERNGSFHKRIYMELIGVEETDPWLEYYVRQPEKYPEVTS